MPKLLLVMMLFLPNIGGAIVPLLLIISFSPSAFFAQPFADSDDHSVPIRHCAQSDLLFQYTPCDQNNKRWLYAVPRSHNFLCTPDSMPTPKNGLNCTVTCPAGHFLEMHSQQCQQCHPGTFSLGDRLRYEQFEGDKLPEGFSVENSANEAYSGSGGADADNECRGGGWTVEEGELRYRWTHCESTLSIALHLVRAGFAEFHYRISRDSRGLLSMLQVRNAQCQSYGSGGMRGTKGYKPLKPTEAEGSTSAAEGDFRVQRLALRAGQNLITWSVSSNPVLSSRMEMIRLLRLDLSGLAFSPDCSACPAGTFAARAGAEQCEPCPEDTFSKPGAHRCAQCPPNHWAEPRSEQCQPRPLCSSDDYHPVRPQQCRNGSRTVYQRKTQPTVCRDGPGAYTPENLVEPCPPCAAGMQRNAESGQCEKCPEGQVSEEGKVCKPCPPDSEPEYGLFINRWDSFLPGLNPNFECEFVSADELPGDCRVSPAWISLGDRLESVQTRLKGVALEMSFHIDAGFYAPLHAGRVSEDNPLAHITVELELRCKDDSCQFYIVQEMEPSVTLSQLLPSSQPQQRELFMLALLNGTQARRTLTFPVTDARPRRLVFAFMRSGAVFGRDALTDRATIYAVNATNTGDAVRKRQAGAAHRCAHCPRRDAHSGTCLPCPQGEYWDNSTCHRCPSGSVLNPSQSGTSPCVPCPPHFVGSADGFSCEFSGHFDMDSEEETASIGEGKRAHGERMHFDLSALRDVPMSATGIRVYSRDGQSYSHIFNVSLFADRPVRCRDSLQSAFSTVQSSPEGTTITDDEALFCRSAAVPFGTQKEGQNAKNGSIQLFVSSTIISRKLALITRNRAFRHFRLSNEQLEYDSATPTDHLPLDVHFFFEPSVSSSSAGLPSNCPNGTIGVITVRCEASLVAKPLVRLSRHCPDGTCDGCLYHVLVESAHGCPLCREDDYREIRGECIDGVQQLHSIPSKHCVLSGAQSRQRMVPCRVILSSNVRLLLAIAISLILFLLLLILAIYRRNKALEYRYMRLVEGREMDQPVRTSCAIGESDVDGSEDEDEHPQQQAPRGPRVFFSTRKAKIAGGDKNGGAKRYGGGRTRAEERTEFITEEAEGEESE